MAAPAKQPRFSLPFLRGRAREAAAGLPALLSAAERAAHAVMTGEHRQRKSGAGEKFWQFREYQPTDRPQDIDWRQSGKGDRVFIRQKEWQTTQTALFWRAGGSGMDYRSSPSLPAKGDAASVLALALATLMTRAGEQVALAGSGARPGRSETSVEKLAQTLIESTNAPALPNPATISIPARASMILVGDFLSPLEEVETVFRTLAGRASNAMVIQTLDPAELSLPFTGRVIFEDTGNGARHPVAQVEDVREAYRARIAAHLDGMKELCRRLQWDWLLHTTDEDARDTLRDAWMMMSPGSYHKGSGA